MNMWVMSVVFVFAVFAIYVAICVNGVDGAVVVVDTVGTPCC